MDARADPAKPNQLVWEPDGRWVAYSERRGKIRIEWVGPEHPERLIATLGVTDTVDSLSVSRDSRWLACGTRDGKVAVWQVNLERSSNWIEVSVGTLADDERGGAPTLVAFSPIDDSLAVARGSAVLLLRVDPEALAAAGTTSDETSDLAALFPISLLSILDGDTRGTFVVATVRGQLTMHQEWPGPERRNALLEELAALDERGPATSGDGVAMRASVVRSLQRELLPVGIVQARAIADDTALLALRVDAEIADIPWELLLADDEGPPLGVTRGLVRGPLPADAQRSPIQGIALIVDYPRRTESAGLTAAREADMIGDWIDESESMRGVALRLHRPDPRELISALLGNPIRVLFIAGQGVRRTAYADGAEPFPRPGVVLSQDTFLTTAEFGAMRQVPEVVYLSCAYLSRMAADLLRMGVRVVVAPLWAVNEQGAVSFSTAFFSSLLQGEPLIRATQKARAATHRDDPDSTAWAAYQVHGDPGYRFEREQRAVEPASSSAPAAKATQDPSEDSPTQANEELGRLSPQPSDVSLGSKASTRGRLTSTKDTQPFNVGISVAPGNYGYDVVVWGAVASRARLNLRPDALISATQTLLDEVRTVVMHQDTSGDYVFQTGIDIADVDRVFALKTLARAGALLFQRLFFGTAATADSKAVGNLLRDWVSDPSKLLKLQILAEGVVIPWQLLYVGDASAGAVLDWNLFLGMSSQIEEMPLQKHITVADATIASDRPRLSVSLNVNSEIDAGLGIPVVADQNAYWTQAAKRLRIAVTSRTTGADVLRALADPATDDQIMYFYCHGQVAGPTDAADRDTWLAFADRTITLADLYLDAPTTTVLRGAPLVFLNASEAGSHGFFAPYFIAKGARGVIGPQTKLPALFAAEWAKSFFERFLGGAPLGEVFLSLRREFLEVHGNPLGLLYAVHGDGDTRIEPPVL